MRFNDDGTIVAFTHGYGGGELSVQLVDAVDGHIIAVLPAGHDPRWVDASHLVARSPDGIARSETENGFAIDYLPANDDDIDARGGRVASTADRAAGVTVTAANAAPQHFPSTFEPALSMGGSIALRDLGSGSVRIERLLGCTDAPAGEPTIGPGTRPRWSGQTVVLDTVPFGRVLGRTSPDQPTAELVITDRACTHPVVLWTGARLIVGLVLDDGDLALADWGDLVARHDVGWPVGVSGESGFDWDIVTAPSSTSVVRVAYLTAAGELARIDIDIAATLRVSLAAAKPPDPPDPVDPPDPPDPPDPVDPPDPPDPPSPEDGDMNPTVDMIPRDQTVMAADAIDDYLVGNPRLGLPDGIWPSDFYSVGNAERLDVISAYLIGVWCPYVCTLGPFPGDAPGWETRRNLGLDHTFHVIESERGEKPSPPEPVAPGTLRGPIGTDRRFFTSP
jgi:hypothetical protein